MSDSTQEEAHTGPIKTPKQLLLAVFFSFVIPVFAIIALVAYVVAENKPAGSADTDSRALGGVSAQDVEKGMAERIRKVGMVEIRDANRPLKSGEEVFKGQCTTCHSAGVAGAPKLGDTAAWAPRIRTGLDALVQSALKGKGAMPAQGGGDFDNVEIARGVAYMANAAGAKFEEPKAPAATATARRPTAPRRKRACRSSTCRTCRAASRTFCSKDGTSVPTCMNGWPRACRRDRAWAEARAPKDRLQKANAHRPRFGCKPTAPVCGIRIRPSVPRVPRRPKQLMRPSRGSQPRTRRAGSRNTSTRRWPGRTWSMHRA